jgi:hypothetical protein
LSVFAWETYDQMFGEAAYWETNPPNSIFTGENFTLKGQMSDEMRSYYDMFSSFSTQESTPIID